MAILNLPGSNSPAVRNFFRRLGKRKKVRKRSDQCRKTEIESELFYDDTSSFDRSYCEISPDQSISYDECVNTSSSNLPLIQSNPILPNLNNNANSTISVIETTGGSSGKIRLPSLNQCGGGYETVSLPVFGDGQVANANNNASTVKNTFQHFNTIDACNYETQRRLEILQSYHTNENNANKCIGAGLAAKLEDPSSFFYLKTCTADGIPFTKNFKISGTSSKSTNGAVADMILLGDGCIHEPCKQFRERCTCRANCLTHFDSLLLPTRFGVEWASTVDRDQIQWQKVHTCCCANCERFDPNLNEKLLPFACCKPGGSMPNPYFGRLPPSCKDRGLKFGTAGLGGGHGSGRDHHGHRHRHGSGRSSGSGSSRSRSPGGTKKKKKKRSDCKPLAVRTDAIDQVMDGRGCGNFCAHNSLEPLHVSTCTPGCCDEGWNCSKNNPKPNHQPPPRQRQYQPLPQIQQAPPPPPLPVQYQSPPPQEYDYQNSAPAPLNAIGGLGGVENMNFDGLIENTLETVGFAANALRTMNLGM